MTAAAPRAASAFRSRASGFLLNPATRENSSTEPSSFPKMPEFKSCCAQTKKRQSEALPDRDELGFELIGYFRRARRHPGMPPCIFEASSERKSQRHLNLPRAADGMDCLSQTRGAGIEEATDKWIALVGRTCRR